MRVVCAPNAFKGTLSALGAARAMAAGVRRAGGEPLEHPVADGGDGTLDVLLAAAPGARILTAQVAGPLGHRVDARWGMLDTRRAVVELAEASGLRLLDPTCLRAREASTAGLGELLAIAAAAAPRVLIGLGGSATSDGGAGLLAALGARFRDSGGEVIENPAGRLHEIASADLAPVRGRLGEVTLDVAVDVDSPLTGPLGAARLFAPQKGATPADVEYLEAALAHFAAVVEAAVAEPGLSSRPGMGAAGGSAFGLAALGARLRDGAQLICDETELDAALASAHLVLTGEGRLDAQTARGKAPAEVARRARERGIPCVALAGEVTDSLPSLFSAALALGPGTAGSAEATAAALEAAAARALTQARGVAP